MSLSNFSFAFYGPADDGSGRLQKLSVSNQFTHINPLTEVVALQGTASYIAMQLGAAGMIVTHAHLMSGSQPLGKPTDLMDGMPYMLRIKDLGELRKLIVNTGAKAAGTPGQALAWANCFGGSLSWRTDEPNDTPVSDIWSKLPILARWKLSLMAHTGNYSF